MAAKFDLVVAAKTVGAGSIKRLGNSMQGVQGRVKNLRLAMMGLNKAFGALGLIISGGAFVGLVKGAIDSADAFGKMSDQTGIAANTLQAYVNAGKLAGVSQETIDKGLRRLAQSMREADQGVATYKDSFDALGISVTALGASNPMFCLPLGTKNNGLPWSCNVTIESDLYTAIKVCPNLLADIIGLPE